MRKFVAGVADLVEEFEVVFAAPSEFEVVREIVGTEHEGFAVDRADFTVDFFEEKVVEGSSGNKEFFKLDLAARVGGSE